ncbi:MAG: hypothetical protein M3Y24_05185 [Acidobacteriota bacterium]|nr:hypothetical protein [Acidobacteriota bacterium]
MLITDRAAFMNGQYAVDTYWQIKAGHAHWYFLSLMTPDLKSVFPNAHDAVKTTVLPEMAGKRQ